MPSYTIDSRSSSLVVTARSSVHDTDTSWSGMVGTIDVDLTRLEEIEGEIEVDMTTADAGDWLKNRKLRKDMDFGKYPRATVKIHRLTEVSQDGSTVSATLHGTLSWRDRSVEILARGDGTLTETGLNAYGVFELDVTKLGITPPKVLMIKINNVVECRVKISAQVS